MLLPHSVTQDHFKTLYLESSACFHFLHLHEPQLPYACMKARMTGFYK